MTNKDVNIARIYDDIVRNKVLKKCIDNEYETYSKISLLLNTKESFVKTIFSEKRRKLNLYHLSRLAYKLECSIVDFLPNAEDYERLYGSDISEYEAFLKSIGDTNYE